MKSNSLRDALSLPQLYRFFMHVTGNLRARRVLAEEWVRACPGDRGEFACQRVSDATLAHGPGFDVVIASGIVHHLEDDEALQLFRLSLAALKPGGRLITHGLPYVPYSLIVRERVARGDESRSFPPAQEE